MITVAVLIVASILGTGPASANGQRHEQVRVVASFDAGKGQHPENLAVAPDGAIYVTWLFAHSVVAIRAGAGQSVVTIGGRGDEVSGVAIDPVHPDRLTVGVISKDVATSGIWSVPVGAFHGHDTPTRSVALPVGAFVNGITYAADGTLYVADSLRGLILQVPRGSSSATTWLSSDLLTPTGATFQGVPLPGVNGLKLHRGALYATNTARGPLLRIPIRHHTAGIPVIAKAGLAFDDFVVDADGMVTAALNISNQVIRLTPAGPVVVIADKAHDDVENPSAVAFGPHHELLITSSAYFGTHPALQAIDHRFQREKARKNSANRSARACSPVTATAFRARKPSSIPMHRSRAGLARQHPARERPHDLRPAHRDYAAKRTATGNSCREIMRPLQRYITDRHGLAG